MLLNIGISSWAGDLKDVGAIYPFQGTEVAMVIAAVAFWIGWHIWQIRHENQEIEEKRAHINNERVKAAIDRY
jgi:hypothetical protein